MVMHSVLAGLQALPKGQFEAALTQGFSAGQSLRLILLPQTLRNVLPSLVGIFIGLLKDTSLAVYCERTGVNHRGGGR
ncbi:Inner membrane amino-acid ABC transporter permease protein yhdY [Kluyvera cryocrescens]|uniref:Inner membrane amino-acid ABC transporter permease protein yhdY n=1 Tax=Kluyvera cryocrescens TaxID=580 RepID=A0A485CDY7_KLUCR|nr:Inner membrane amino-acid ABC transporter permease protein yhdY [Kluyvera cryocrescens]